MLYIDQSHSSSSHLISFVGFIFSLTGRERSSQHFLSRIVASVSTNKLVLAHPSTFVLSCLCCYGCDLLLTCNLTSIGKIETFEQRLAPHNSSTFHFIHQMVQRSFYATHFSASDFRNIASITGRRKLLSSFIFFYFLFPNKNRFILVGLLQASRSRAI